MTREVDARRLLGLLGFAAKARKLCTGTDLVLDAVRRHGSANHKKSQTRGLVIIAADASQNTKKRIENCCAHYGVPCFTVQIPKYDLSRAIGKMSLAAVCGVFDKGFTPALLKLLQEENGQGTTIIMEERNAEKMTFSQEGKNDDHK